MNKTAQKKTLKEIKGFINGYFHDESLTKDMQFLTGEEGMEFSDYAVKSSPYISFDGFLYEFVNYGEVDGWKFKNALDKFLDSKGLWYEQGESWNMNILEK